MTATIVGALLWAHARESRRNARVSTPEALTYVSTNAIREGGPITVEIPRLAAVIPIRSRCDALSLIPDTVAGQLYRLGRHAASHPGHRLT